ncbi:glycosyltransferase family 2 protein [Candidatus Woesebacteria bacterium]|nr:MAG: glycosyltransferase family 2 protein [Candidatus Woesebacteria bacterium]
MTNKTKLSVVIIAKNEQSKIVDAIESAGFADEVIVIDNYSSDLTSEVSRRAGAKVYEKAKGDFNRLRDEGKKKAKGEWLFYLDCDERITDDLKKEMLSIVTDTQLRFTAYAVPRKNIIFGKEFRFGGQWPDYQHRLFRKSALKKWVGNVHERPVFDGELSYLSNHLIHLKHDNLSDMMAKTNKWSEIEAKLMFDAHHPPMNIVRFFTATMREAWSVFILKQGFRDKTEGVIYSLFQIYSRFTSYAKLWEMQERKLNKVEKKSD